MYETNVRIFEDTMWMLYEVVCDSKSTINIAHNHVQYDRTKHIEIHWHFNKETFDSGLMTNPYIYFRYQRVDKCINVGFTNKIIQPTYLEA